MTMWTHMRHVIYRDSLVDSSVCQQQSASTSGPTTIGPGPKTLRFNGSMQPGRSMGFNSETAGQVFIPLAATSTMAAQAVRQAFPIGNSMDSHLAYADRVGGLPSGFQLADLDLSPRDLPAVSWDNGVDWESDDQGEEEPAAPRPNRNPLVSSLSTQPIAISPGQSSSQNADLHTCFLMKLFKSVNLDLINECRFCFNFSLL